MTWRKEVWAGLHRAAKQRGIRLGASAEIVSLPPPHVTFEGLGGMSAGVRGAVEIGPALVSEGVSAAACEDCCPRTLRADRGTMLPTIVTASLPEPVMHHLNR